MSTDRPITLAHFIFIGQVYRLYFTKEFERPECKLALSLSKRPRPVMALYTVRVLKGCTQGK